MQKKLISIVVPVYNEEKNVEEFHRVVSQVLQDVSAQYDFEFVFTDNHSTDQTYTKLQALALKDERIRVFRFSRNFGYQRSILTGYGKARGQAAVQLDCDLQDPPEMIIDFLKSWESGHKVVYGIRRSREESWIMNTFRKIFYRMINSLSESELPIDAGDFRLIDRLVIDELVKIQDCQLYLRGTIADMGFDQKGIAYDRRKREHGETKFSSSDLIKLATDGILNHSMVPLRIATYTGLAVSFFTFIVMIGYLIGRMIWGNLWPAGFATTTILILISLSLNALFLGAIGEYLGRIYRQLKKPSLTVIETQIDR